MDTTYIQELLRQEQAHGPHDYMSKMAHLKKEHRMILVEWLVGVWGQELFNFQTLGLTLNYMDRYFALTPKIKSRDFQLVAITCLYLASKFEEVYFIDINNALYYCDGAYTEKEIYEMEKKIMVALDYKLHVVVLPDFIRIWRRLLPEEMQTINRSYRCLAWYLAVLCLFDYDLVARFKPSVLAAGVFLITTSHFDEKVTWSSKMKEGTGCEMGDILPCALRLIRIWRLASITKGSTLKSVKFHFSRKKLSGVSKFKPHDCILNLVEV